MRPDPDRPRRSGMIPGVDRHCRLAGPQTDRQPDRQFSVVDVPGALAVPLLYQQSAGAICKGIISTNWKSYGLGQSRGSLYELIDHLLVAVECEYLAPKASNDLIEEIKTAIIILNGYIKYLKKQKANT